MDGAAQSSREVPARSTSNAGFAVVNHPEGEEESMSNQKMDGVAFLINQDLSERGNASDDRANIGSSDSDERLHFPESYSAFDNEGGGRSGWRPRHGSDIPMANNEKVQKWVKIFSGSLRSNFARWLGRASQHGELVESILREYHLPMDLIYLAMIESGFNLNAYSHASAAGPWQFIRSTGKLYGLDSGAYVDERRDIEKATRAAAEHLRDLYKMYGDWNLAFAAYNAGAGSVNKAIARSGTRDYWKMTSGKKRFLRPETIDYVPRIMAAAIVAKNYKKYGFSSDIFKETQSFEKVTVPDSTDLALVADCAGVGFEDVKNLNPQYVMNVTPPNERCEIKLPEGTSDRFKENYARVPASQRVKLVYHKVTKRDTLATIAKRYGTTASLLAQANGLSTKSKPKIGTRLMIPRKSNPNLMPANALASNGINSYRAGQTEELAATPTTATAAVTESVVTTYKVKKGETLSAIAKRYGLTLSEIKSMNGLSKNTLKYGQVLKVKTAAPVQVASAPVSDTLDAPSYVVDDVDSNDNRLAAADFSSAATPSFAEQKVYVVQPGDTLWKIATNAGITVGDLIEVNPKISNGHLEAHQKLILPASGRISSANPARIDKHIDARVGKKIVHLVRVGETLWDVSKKYRVTVAQIKTWNRLKGNQVYPKQKLIVYPASSNPVAAR